MKLSFVIPVYNEEKNINNLCGRLTVATQRIGIGDYEIIFVDDGSKDSSCEAIKKLSSQDKSVKLVKLSRNFGQHLAIMAGLDNSNGDAVIVMDADLQDDPLAIDKLYSKYNEGFDIIYATRFKRKENILKRFCFFIFHKMISSIADVPIHKDAGTFSLMSKRVVAEIIKQKEYRPYVPGLRAYVGFKSSGIKIERSARNVGKGKSFANLMRLALDTIYSHSFFPLKLISFIFVFSLFISSAIFVHIAYKKLVFDVLEKNDLFFFLAVILSTGVLFSLTAVSKYVAMIFEESRKRTRYVVEETMNL